MNEMEQAKRVSLHADVMLRRALDLRAKNNVLIAEYMDMIFDDNDKSMMIVKTPQGNDIIYLDELKYHTSWDWLMPVVIKCFEVDDSVNDDLNFKLNDALLETNIDSLYKVVVEFINQLNK